MQVTPFLKATADWMPWYMAAQSFTMSVVQLTIFLPQAHEKITETRMTPRRARQINESQLKQDAEKHLYKRIAHATNILGTAAYLSMAEPVSLVVCYLFWTAHYAAQVMANPLEKNDLKEHSWRLLYGFGALTCLASALLAQGGIPLTVVIVVTRMAATLLSQIETALFFGQVLLQTGEFTKNGANRLNQSMNA